MAKKKQVETAASIAAQLSEVRHELNLLKKDEKDLAEVLKRMIKSGEQQDLFTISESTSLAIKDASLALKFAQQYAPSIISVNTTLARKVFLGDALTGSLGTPESHGFALKTTETLREIKGEADEL